MSRPRAVCARPRARARAALTPPTRRAAPAAGRYFTGEHADHSSEPPSAKTLSVFKDPNATKRTVSSISFHPDGGRKLAVAFSLLQFQDERTHSASNLS